MTHADLAHREGRFVKLMSSASDDADAQDLLPIEPVESADDPMPSADHPFPTALLALGSVRGVGTKLLRGLAGRLGENLGQVWSLSPDQLTHLLAECKAQAPAHLAATIQQDREQLLGTAREHLDRLSGLRISILSPDALPSKLRKIPGRPEWLFVQGSIEALEGVHLAIVGSRSPSEFGLRATEAAARVASAYPLTVVSGLAEGVDAAAHWASMNEGIRNVAFLGHGIDITFPATTASIRERIVAAGGAVATEYLPWEHYRKEQFVQRNRLQAGLSDMVLIVDAKASGGTSHTARFALQYKRRLLALTWSGVADLATELSRAGKCETFEIFTVDGTRALDGAIRTTIDQRGVETNALTVVLRHLAHEYRIRTTRPEDLRALQAAIDRLTHGPEGAL